MLLTLNMGPAELFKFLFERLGPEGRPRDHGGRWFKFLFERLGPRLFDRLIAIDPLFKFLFERLGLNAGGDLVVRSGCSNSSLSD